MRPDVKATELEIRPRDRLLEGHVPRLFSSLPTTSEHTAPPQQGRRKERVVTAIFGETLTFGQENGPDVRLVVYGDEFYARYETQEGYPVVSDPDRSLFCYALLRDGAFVSSGVPIAEQPPVGAERHVEESEAVRRLKFAKKYASRSPPDERK